MTRSAIALDLGGTQVRAALVRNGAVLRKATAKTDVAGGPAAVMAQFAALVAEICGETVAADIAGVGISSAGPLDTESGVVLGIPTIPGWDRFPFRAAVAERFGLPVVLENDAIAAAYGEWRHGAGKGLRHMVYVTVSTGIGGGAIVDGRLLHGRMGMAGHVGHMRLAQDGPVCACGATACFEALASGTAVGLRARRAAADHPDSHLGRAARRGQVEARDVFEGARQGDAICLDLLAEEARYLGQGFTGIIHVFSPERIVMGGGVAQAFELLSGGIRATIARDAVAPFKPVEVVAAALGDNAGLIGAAALLLRPASADAVA